MLELAHFRRHKRKALKKTPGKSMTYPFHKPEEKHSPGKDVTKKVSNVIDKAVNIAKSSKTKKVKFPAGAYENFFHCHGDMIIMPDFELVLPLIKGMLDEKVN